MRLRGLCLAFVSIEFIAMILIGGAGTIAGTLMGTVFVTLLPRFVQDFALWLVQLAEGEGVGSFLSSSSQPPTPATAGWSVPARWAQDSVSSSSTSFAWRSDRGLLIFEPLGFYGIWIRIRSHWKAWSFSYQRPCGPDWKQEEEEAK